MSNEENIIDDLAKKYNVYVINNEHKHEINIKNTIYEPKKENKNETIIIMINSVMKEIFSKKEGFVRRLNILSNFQDHQYLF